MRDLLQGHRYPEVSSYNVTHGMGNSKISLSKEEEEVISRERSLC